MIEISLSQTPNQSFSIQLNSHQYDMTIRSVNANDILGVGIMAIDILKDNVAIVTGNRCNPFSPLIPYNYLENGEGNFFFFTLNNEYPNYTQFGITQALLYLSPTELEVIRAGT